MIVVRREMRRTRKRTKDQNASPASHGTRVAEMQKGTHDVQQVHQQQQATQMRSSVRHLRMAPKQMAAGGGKEK